VGEPRVLIAVPTLGTRLEHLESCLVSIAAQDVPTQIVVISPDSPPVRNLAMSIGATWIPDPGSQTAAINIGIATAGEMVEYVNWLGDDDVLTPGSLRLTTSALDRNHEAVVAYGACRYIDANNRQLWVSKAGPWASRILGWGPDLIPQPGMLVRRHAWEDVGGLDESYRFAFDLDLLLKLRQHGSLIDVGNVVSAFRWHPDSLTVSDRDTNLRESERAKRAFHSPTQRRLAWMWEKPVRAATRLAAMEMNRRARKLST
jgi:GT2 family glycosyltransferase